MIDLSPCPFCGGAARAISLGAGTWEIACATCHASTGLGLTDAEAAARWNARPAPARAAPAPGPVRVVRRYEVWSDGAYRVMAAAEGVLADLYRRMTGRESAYAFPVNGGSEWHVLYPDPSTKHVQVSRHKARTRYEAWARALLAHYDLAARKDGSGF